MTVLPAAFHDFQEAAAVAFAKERIAIYGSGDFFDPGYGAFHPEAGRVFLRRIMGNVASISGEALLDLIDYARSGWDDADEVLRQMIVEHIHRGEEMSPFLKTYEAEILSGRRIRKTDGQQLAGHFISNLVIVMIVIETMHRFNLKPTRQSRRKLSAAAVVAEALTQSGLTRGTEAAITKIWQRWGERFLRNWPGALTLS
jgi:hypothetical protein